METSTSWSSFSPNGPHARQAPAATDSLALEPHRGKPTLLGKKPLVGCENCSVHRLAFGPEGRTLAAAGDHGVVLWNARRPASPGPRRRLAGSSGTVYDVAFSPRGRVFASAGSDGKVRLWNVRRGTPRGRLGAPLVAHEGAVYTVAFSPDGDNLASAGEGGLVRLWNVCYCRSRAVSVTAAVSTPSLLRQAVATRRPGASPISWPRPARAGTVRLWPTVCGDLVRPDSAASRGRAPESRLQPGRAHPRRRRRPWRREVLDGGYEPANRPDASGQERDSHLQRRVRPGRPHARRGWLCGTALEHPGATQSLRLDGSQQSVTSVAFSPDGHRVASGGSNGTVWLWELDPWHPTQQIGRPLVPQVSSMVNSVAFSPNGNVLAAAYDDVQDRALLEHPHAEERRPARACRRRARLCRRVQPGRSGTARHRRIRWNRPALGYAYAQPARLASPGARRLALCRRFQPGRPDAGRRGRQRNGGLEEASSGATRPTWSHSSAGSLSAR